jgi:acetyltransferase-like isoleucine patch superfamily enzyme
VIGAGAVVRDDVPGWAVAAGVPARVVSMRTP